MSPFLSGAMVPRVAIWIPMEAGFEKPQSAYVAMVTDRSDGGSTTPSALISRSALYATNSFTNDFNPISVPTLVRSWKCYLEMLPPALCGTD